MSLKKKITLEKNQFLDVTKLEAHDLIGSGMFYLFLTYIGAFGKVRLVKHISRDDETSSSTSLGSNEGNKE